MGVPPIMSSILCRYSGVRKSHSRYKSPAASSLFLSMILLLFFLLILISVTSTSESSRSSSLFSPSNFINFTIVSLFYFICMRDSWVIRLPLRISVRNMLRSRASEADIELIITEISSFYSYYSYFFA